MNIWMAFSCGWEGLKWALASSSSCFNLHLNLAAMDPPWPVRPPSHRSICHAALADVMHPNKCMHIASTLTYVFREYLFYALLQISPEFLVQHGTMSEAIKKEDEPHGEVKLRTDSQNLHRAEEGRRHRHFGPRGKNRSPGAVWVTGGK